jgi:hypothetical protein
MSRFHEIQYAGLPIEDDLGAIIFNPIASTILKLWRFKLMRWMQYLHQSAFISNGLSLVTIVGLHRNPLWWRNGTQCWNSLMSNNEWDWRATKGIVKDIDEKRWFGIIFVQDWPKTHEWSEIRWVQEWYKMWQWPPSPRGHYSNNGICDVGWTTAVDSQCTEREQDRRVPTVGQQW